MDSFRVWNDLLTRGASQIKWLFSGGSVCVDVHLLVMQKGFTVTMFLACLLLVTQFILWTKTQQLHSPGNRMLFGFMDFDPLGGAQENSVCHRGSQITSVAPGRRRWIAARGKAWMTMTQLRTYYRARGLLRSVSSWFWIRCLFELLSIYQLFLSEDLVQQPSFMRLQKRSHCVCKTSADCCSFPTTLF